MTQFIQGEKGGKGGGGARTPVESPNSLRSASFARIIDVISEGEIEGLVDGHKSIYFDDTPLVNADGTYNFKDVAVEVRTGTIGQALLTNTDGVESTQTISTALKYNQPVVRSILTAGTDMARLGIAVGQLSQTNTENGDIKGTSVQHKIEYRANGGAWITVKTDTITGKTMSGYERQITFKLTGSAPWDVRVTRLTADSSSSALANASTWTTLTGVVTDKFRYPATALIGIQINAEQFNNIPTRSYDIKGIKVKVPSNYNPLTRAYTGAWDGSFKVAWSDNPAWCLYDLLINKRYGLGSRIDAGMLDKWKFYQIAQYCDQLVPDGKGGTEPRFTCNLYLQTRVEAYKFIQDMASIFRGITYWATGAIIVNQDAPAPVRYQFNNTNVEGGIFDRAGSNVQTRHNVALVSWNDPSNGYKQSIEYVEDFAAIQKMGYVSETEVSAFGCTSQGMARRYGEWLLYVEQNESEIISFTTGQEGVIPLPGDVIQVSDAFHTGKRVSGRVLSGSTQTSIQLDSAVTLESGKTYKLHVIDADGGFQTGTISTDAGTVSTVSVTGISKVLAENTTWVLSSDDLQPELFRVVGVDEVEAGKYRVSCLSYNPSKYSYVERQQALQAPQTSNLGSMQPDVANVVVTEQTNYDKNDIPISRLLVTWKPVNAVSTAFFVEYRTADGQWQRTTTTTQYSAEIPLLSDATSYEIRVIAGNRMLGSWANNPQTITYTPEAYSVPNITNLVMATAWATGQDVTIKWDVVNAKAYEVQVLEGATVRRTIKATESTYTYTAQDYKADGCNTRSLTFKVRAISSNGRTGAWSQVVATNAQIGALQGIKITSGVTQAFFEYAKPADSDFAGLCIWVDTTANFTPSDANKVFDGNDAVITLSKLGNGAPLVGGQTYYLRAAGYDTFGKDTLAISASTAFSIYSVTSQVQALQKSQLSADLQAPIELITAPASTAGSVNARIAQEATDRANAVTAEAQTRATADSTEKTERVNADSALSSRIDTISATVNTNNSNQTAALQTEQTARVNADGALGTRIDTVVAQANTDRSNYQALVNNEAAARANADGAQASQINTLIAKTNVRPNLCADVDKWTISSAMFVEYGSDWGTMLKTNATGTQTALSPFIGVREGGVYTLTYDSLLFANGGSVYLDLQGYDASDTEIWDAPQTTRSDRHDFSTTNSNRDRNAMQYTIPANVVKVRVRWVCQSIIGSNIALGIRQVKFEFGALPATAYTMEAQANLMSATISAVNQAAIDRDNAQASQITTLQTQTNSNTASIQTQANSINGLSAQYTVKTDVNGYVAGYGLATTANNGAPTSAFIVNADKFGVGAAGKGTAMPFVVDTVNNKVGINGGAVIQGTLTASKAVIGSSSDNIIPDAEFYDLAWWKRAGLATVRDWTGQSTGWKSRRSMYLENGDTLSLPFGCDVGATYRIKIQVNIPSGFNGKFSPFVHVPTIQWLPMSDRNAGTLSTGNVCQFDANSAKGLFEFETVYTNPSGNRDRIFQIRLIVEGNTGALPEIGGISITRMGDASLIVDGAVKARHIEAGSITADKLSVTDLSAVAANLGNVTITKGQGSDPYGWIRTNGKWWADSADGTVIARNNNDGSTFFDSKAGSNRIWMSSWNDCGIEFPGIRMTNGGLTINQLDVIGTLNIRGNAVTQPVSVSSNSQISGNAGWQNVLNCSVNLPQAGNLFVLGNMRQGFPSGPSTFGCRILVDGATWYDTGVLGAALDSFLSPMSSKQVAAGTHTVELYWYGASSVRLGDRGLFVLGTVR